MFKLILLYILIIIIVCVFVWKRETKKNRKRIEKLYADGVLVKPKQKLDIIDYDALKEISRIVSCGDETVLSPVCECVSDHTAYYKKHKQEYAEQGIDSIEGIDPEELCWFNMVNLLVDNQYAARFDYKTDLEDILYLLKPVAGKMGLPFDIERMELLKTDEMKSAFSKRGDNEILTDLHLCVISENLSRLGWALGYIDSGDSDSVLFLTDPVQKEKLEALSEKYGRTVGFDYKRHY